MIVPEDVRDCVAFVGYKKADGSFRFAGTAFFLHRVDPDCPGVVFSYTVTARHVVNKIRDLGVDKVYLRLNTDNGAEWASTELSAWKFHPSDASVDVAVYPIPIVGRPGIQHKTFPVKASATPAVIHTEKIGPGEEVFVTGLFIHHFGKTRNIPIVRAGNIAAIPRERVHTDEFGAIEAYLIEMRSIGGLSGSPVFVHQGIVRLRDGRLMYSDLDSGIFYLLGLMHGHYDIEGMTDMDASGKPDQINMGIGVVVPVEKILEVTKHPEIIEMERKVKEKVQKSSSPTQDDALGVDIGHEMDARSFTQQEFEDSLRKASRKIDPEK